VSLGNFEIRLYNKPTAAKPFAFLWQLHDKLMLVDGEHYITGGRNLGEVYFDLAEKKNKVDRDIYVRGSTARAAQAYFDELWNSNEVTPIPHKPYTLENMSPDYCEDPERAGKRCVKLLEKRRAAVQAEVDKLEEAIAQLQADPDYQEAIADQTPYLMDIPDDQIRFIHDAVGGKENREVNDVLDQVAKEADGEILCQSPYVVPDKGLLDLFKMKKAEGVPVTFVTNSSKSTVNVIAQAGYQRYRKRMLDAGATFIESTGTYMLHAKSLVTRSKDGSCVGGIGSFNIDPRSGYLNTETYVLIHNCEFADELEQYIRSYAVDGIVLSSRKDLKKLKPMKKEVPFGKRFVISILKFLTPLYRSQL
jgi:putative cardiolipin synthase